MPATSLTDSRSTALGEAVLRPVARRPGASGLARSMPARSAVGMLRIGPSAAPPIEDGPNVLP
ncbi:hypothetical protein, partial [uncultured Methylobacterium sp.]|uniref:hypothetical protein n=1 Tax=uncultured Methylobacterium sp. TaxID=157278 RepID=UPI0035CC1DF8